jgi:hypothetical protein
MAPRQRVQLLIDVLVPTFLSCCGWWNSVAAMQHQLKVETGNGARFGAAWQQQQMRLDTGLGVEPDAAGS